MTSTAPNDDLEPYWSALAAGTLLLRFCESCDRPHHYPRSFCPHCWSTDLRWVEASGQARVHSYSVVHAGDERQLVALVELAEGPKVTSILVDVEPSAVEVDAAVVLVAATRHDRPVPAFKPG